MSEEKLFEEYMEEKPRGFKALTKTTKGRLILFGILLGIFLLAYFYKLAVLDVMSGEEIKESIEVVWSETQWVEKDVTPQKVTVVPSISVKIKNVGKQELQYLDVQAVFINQETGGVFNDWMVRALREPLKPGETSGEITVQAAFGYSGSSQAAIVNNPEWKKMETKIFARAKGSPLVQIGGVFPVKHVLKGYDSTAKIEAPVPEETQYTDAPTQELMKSLQIQQQSSLWVDKVATRKQVIIVPSITITVKNMGDKPLKNIYFKGVFHKEDTGEVLSEGITPAFKKELAPGETSKEIVIKADFGFSATSMQAFYNTSSTWKRVKVRIYAKDKDTNDAILGTYPVIHKIKGVKVNYQ